MCLGNSTNGHSLSVSEEVPEYNTDQGSGTHQLCQQLVSDFDFNNLWRAQLFSKEALHVDASALLDVMNARREQALRTAESLSSHALKQKMTAANAIFSILDKRGIRRGTAKSASARQQCLLEIESALAKPGVLTLAVLTFPFRDMHPFKNVGQSADAGELESLIRLWTIGKAINLCGVECKVVALRDGNRYPCTWHIPSDQKRAYGDGFRQMVHALSLDDVLDVRDVDDRTEAETMEAWQTRMQGHAEAYQSELKRIMEEMSLHQDGLFSAASETEFAKLMTKLPYGKTLLDMFYPMLHWSPPCATPSGIYGVPERQELIRRLVNVFQPDACPELEGARRELLWDALTSAAQYVSSYKSRSAANNTLGLDDVTAVAPDSLRLSIHNKSKDNGSQFPVEVAANVHRMPWHGSAELRFSRQQKHAVIDVKLAAEMWHSHIAVVPEITSTSQLASVLEDPRKASWFRYCTALEQAQQPFFFADAATLPSGWDRAGGLAPLMTHVAEPVPERRKQTQRRATLPSAERASVDHRVVKEEVLASCSFTSADNRQERSRSPQPGSFTAGSFSIAEAAA